MDSARRVLLVAHMFDKDKILNDLGRLTGGAANAASDAGRKLKDEIRTHVDDMAHRLDLVPRDDFDRLESLLSSALLRIEALENRENDDKTAKPKVKAKTKPKPKSTPQKTNKK